MSSEDEITLDGKLLKDLKLAELKKACRERDLPINGTKATVLKRLKAVSKYVEIKENLFPDINILIHTAILPINVTQYLAENVHSFVSPSEQIFN